MIISKEHFAPATTPKKDIFFPAILRPFNCDHLVRLGQDYDGTVYGTVIKVLERAGKVLSLITSHSRF